MSEDKQKKEQVKISVPTPDWTGDKSFGFDTVGCVKDGDNWDFVGYRFFIAKSNIVEGQLEKWKWENSMKQGLEDELKKKFIKDQEKAAEKAEA